MVDIGSTIRKLRLARGWSLRAAARECNISCGLLSLIENDKVGLSDRTQMKLDWTFGVDVYVLAWCHSCDTGNLPSGRGGTMRARTQLLVAFRRQLGWTMPHEKRREARKAERDG